MCVIIAMETVVPSKETFELCEKKNPHGGGISWIQDGELRYKKGIKSDEIYKIAIEFGPPCIAHFRISTVGGTPKELCHPFVVSNKSELDLEGKASSVLFHNGHWAGWEKTCLNMILTKNAFLPVGAFSDSRAMAWVTSYCNPTWLGFIGQKVVVQTKTTRNYFGDWQEKDDVYYSNLNWEPKITVTEPDWWKGYNSKDGQFVYGKDKDGKDLCCDLESSNEYLRRRGYNI